MDSVWMLYWLTRLFEIGQFLLVLQCIVAVVIALTFFPGALVVSDMTNEPWGEWKKWLTRFVVVFLVVSFTKVFIPSKEDAMFIAAGAGVIEAAKSETAQRVAGKSVAVIEKYLDDLIKEDKDGNTDKK